MSNKDKREQLLNEAGYVLAPVSGNRVCNICGLNCDQVIIQLNNNSNHYYCSSCTTVFLSKINSKL